METKQPHRYIALDGPIGAGKTTLAKMLAGDLGGKAVFEPAEKNPFLPEFYKDRKRNAFKTQLFFLLSRYQQQLEVKQQNLFENVVVCDYTFGKDMIFARINLSEDERALYETVYNLLDARLPKPDLVVYIQANPEVLIQRIKIRGYNYEKPVDIDYLETVTNAYNEYFFQYTETPLLIINSNDLDIVHNPTDWANLKQAIMDHRKGTAHYHYIGQQL